jgi:16S rRNA (cytosine1402-N4)-methyltransferase
MIATGGSMGHETGDRVHVPVLLGEVLEALRGEADAAELEGWIVDGTVGAGGHARAILERFPKVRLFGTDQDPEVIEHARTALAEFGDRVVLCRTRLSLLHPRLCESGLLPGEDVIGFLLDLGANSLHFDRPERGFSFQADGPLDMRMDPTRTRTAADIVNRWDEEDLADLFYYEGDERNSRAIAHAIAEARLNAPFTRTVPLAELIAGQARGRGRIHPATRCFQALRRAVTEEGDELRHGLRVAERVLADRGRLAVITFHSLEDHFVKKILQERARDGSWQLASRKPLGPGAAERRANPRARSALLRAAVRVRASAPPRHGEVYADDAEGLA